jgi:hypothetical protein
MRDVQRTGDFPTENSEERAISLARIAASRNWNFGVLHPFTCRDNITPKRRKTRPFTRDPVSVKK